MRKLRVCIYGGTQLEPTDIRLISELAYNVLDARPAVIVTGGFLHSNADPDATSTDSAALRGARRYAKARSKPLNECFEAWIPDPNLDRRLDVEGAVRMNERDGIYVRVMDELTPLGRRLAMVADVDIVVTIAGKRHTEVVVEQALELGVPVLPIPNAGGDSKNLLRNYRERIASRFGTGALDKCLAEVKAAIKHDPATAAQAVVDLLGTAKVGRCLVLLPYDQVHDQLYSSLIKPVVARHMEPVRLDLLPKSDAIYTSFADAVRASIALIVDVTQLNENVMYEVGYAHGQGLTPLLYTREESRRAQLPVYLRTLNVRLVSEAMPLDALIEGYLESCRDRRLSRVAGHT